MSKPKLPTIVSHAGAEPKAHSGMVSVPVHRASTILFPNYQSFVGQEPSEYTYGRHRTPTTKALEIALSELCAAEASFIYPSGLASITSCLLSLCQQGDHILIGDNCYQPTRIFAHNILQRYGVDAQFFDCRADAEQPLAELLRPNTKAVFVESPGSNSFELSDIASYSSQLRSSDSEAFLIVDNTWASNYYYNPLDSGADASLISASKYLGGHSDLLLGAISTRGKIGSILADNRRWLGQSVNGDDANLVLRGLRSLGARLEQHARSAKVITEWLHARADVSRLMYPPHPSDPYHSIWQRDYSGSPALFGFCVSGYTQQSWQAFFNSLKLCGMGYGWGGFESLLIPSKPAEQRQHCRWEHEGQSLRMHVGLEHPDDLIAELARAFAQLERQ